MKGMKFDNPFDTFMNVVNVADKFLKMTGRKNQSANKNPLD